MKRGEVWWVEFDPAIGSEIAKRRPAIILSNDSANRNLARVVVVPLTSNTTRLYPGEAFVTIGTQKRKAMTDQIMTADKSRLKSKLDEVSKLDLKGLEDADLAPNFYPALSSLRRLIMPGWACCAMAMGA